MLRKLGVACLVVFLSNQDIGVQLLVVMAVIMAALALQVGPQLHIPVTPCTVPPAHSFLEVP